MYAEGIAARKIERLLGVRRHPALQEQLEQVKSKIRAKVEHPFRVIKRQFGHVKVRYRGMKKNTQQLHTLFALANLWMAPCPVTGEPPSQVSNGSLKRQYAREARAY